MHQDQFDEEWSQQAVDDNPETIDDAIRGNIRRWAELLDTLMMDLNAKHNLEKQNSIKKQPWSVYEKTAMLAECYLENANSEELQIVFGHVLTGLTNPNYLGNMNIGSAGRPSELWEHFAHYYLRLVHGESVKLLHKGAKNDYGVDIEMTDIYNRLSIVQVKRGRFFGKGGKGPRIVRELYGSMGLYDNAQFGIIFTNQSKKEVDTEAVRYHIDCYKKKKNVDISFICIDDIREQIQKISSLDGKSFAHQEEDTERFRTFIRTFLQDKILKTVINTVGASKSQPQSQTTKTDMAFYSQQY